MKMRLAASFCAAISLALFIVISLHVDDASAQAGGFCRPPCGAAGVTGVDGGPVLNVTDYETTAALALFVDPTGNDSNACTASGASACLTLQGAENKIPKGIRHPVTVAVATGSYTGIATHAHWFDPVSATNGAYIQWTGTLTTATVATGTASGTATAGTAGSTTTFGTLTDGAQTWTVNNLAGFLIEITGGTGSGQTRIIESNTATAITIEGTWTAPTGTSTYVIRDWGSVITTGVNQPAVGGAAAAAPAGIIVTGNQMSRLVSLAGGNIYFDRLKSTPAAATSIGAIVGTGGTYFNECKLNGATTGAGLRADTSAALNVQDTFISSATSTAVRFDQNGTSALPAGMLNITRAKVTSASSTSVIIAGGTILLSSSSVASTTSASTVLVQLNNAMVTRIINSNFTCTAGGSTVGLLAQSALISGAYNSASLDVNTFNACPTGISIVGPSQFTVTSQIVLTGPVGGTAFSISRGGRLELQVVPVSVTYGTEVSLDGVSVPLATLNAASPKMLSDDYGSWVFLGSGTTPVAYTLGAFTNGNEFVSLAPNGSVAFLSSNQSVYQSVGRTTAQLPVCNGTTAGAFAFDTTVTDLSICNGTAWSGGKVNRSGDTMTGALQILQVGVDGSLGVMGDGVATAASQIVVPNSTGFGLSVGTYGSCSGCCPGSCGPTPGVTGFTVAGSGDVVSGGSIKLTSFTDDSANPGNRTVNKVCGKSAIASAAISVTITNSYAAADSQIVVTPEAADATCLYPRAALPGAGNFVFVMGPANCTAALPFSWCVIPHS